MTKTLGIDFLKQNLGLHEVKDNQKLKDLFKKYSHGNDLLIDPKDTPWCSAIMNVAERSVGNLGTGKLNARSWLTYGTKVASIKYAMRGDLLVFSRGGSSWQGHITYYDGMDSKDIIRCLGGNQSDSISYGYYPVDRLLDIRRPPS